MDRSVVQLVCGREMPGEDSLGKKRPTAIAAVLGGWESKGCSSEANFIEPFYLRLVKVSKQDLEFGLSSCRRG